MRAISIVPDAVSVKANIADPEPLGSTVSAPVPSENEENDPDRLAEVGVVSSVRVPLTLGLVPDAVSVKVKLDVPEPLESVASAPVPSEAEVNDPDRLAEVGVVPIVRVLLAPGLVPDDVSLKVKFAVPESRLSVAPPGAVASVPVALGASVVGSGADPPVPALAQSLLVSLMVSIPLPKWCLSPRHHRRSWQRSPVSSDA